MAITEKTIKCRSCKTEFEPIYRNGIVASRLCLSCLSKKARHKVRLDKAKEKSKAKEKLKTHSEWLNDLQKEINTIVRIIDKGSFCHSTRKTLNKIYDAGHVYTVKAHPEIRFNLFNIYAQSVYANQYLSGDPINYLATLKDVFGIKHLEYVMSLPIKYKDVKLTVVEIKEKILIAKSIVKELKSIERVYSDGERIELRKYYNDKIGIYK